MYNDDDDKDWGKKKREVLFNGREGRIYLDFSAQKDAYARYMAMGFI